MRSKVRIRLKHIKTEHMLMGTEMVIMAIKTQISKIKRTISEMLISNSMESLKVKVY